MTNQNQPQNTKALDEYVKVIHEMSSKLAALTQYADNHGNVNPDDVHWGYVGTINHVNEELTNLINFLGIVPQTSEAGE